MLVVMEVTVVVVEAEAEEAEGEAIEVAVGITDRSQAASCTPPFSFLHDGCRLGMRSCLVADDAVCAPCITHIVQSSVPIVPYSSCPFST